MERLQLIRLPVIQDSEMTLGVFAQYIPANHRSTAFASESICVGVSFDGAACGAALCSPEGGKLYLRWIMVDPQARYCGVGTYLLRGLLGLARHEYAGIPVHCVLSDDMLESSHIPGCLTRAGFSAPQPFATEFSCPLRALKAPGEVPDEALAVMPLLQLPNPVQSEYDALLKQGALPEFVCADLLERPIPSLCLAAVYAGRLAGLFLCEKADDGIALRGLYVLEAYRAKNMPMALFKAAYETAIRSWPQDTLVTGAGITETSYKICRYFFPDDETVKSTLYRAVF